MIVLLMAVLVGVILIVLVRTVTLKPTQAKTLKV